MKSASMEEEGDESPLLYDHSKWMAPPNEEDGWAPTVEVTPELRALIDRHLVARMGLRARRQDAQKLKQLLYDVTPRLAIGGSAKSTPDGWIVFALTFEGIETVRRVRSGQTTEADSALADLLASGTAEVDEDPPGEAVSWQEEEEEGRFRYAELFAGIGGFRAALSRAGGRCGLSCEVDREARQAYGHNWGTPPSSTDIRRLDGRGGAGSIQLLAAGFPCQSFTSAGPARGFAEPSGRLFFQLARVVGEMDVPVLLLENVPHLVRAADGAHLRAVLATLQTLGYRCGWRVLDGSRLLAQNRRRFFLLAVKQSLPAASGRVRWPELPNLGLCFRDIQQTGAFPPGLLLTAQQRERLLTAPWRLRKYPDPALRRVPVAEPDRPTRTLMASYRRSFLMHSQFVALPDDRYRFFTAREVASAQGFPPTFRLDASGPERVYSQLGNAVPPPLVAALVPAVLSLLGLDPTPDDEQLARQMALEVVA